MQLEDWITGMLSGASSLKHIRLPVELLQGLPMSRRAALRSLCTESCLTQARAVPDVVQAVLDCQQLEELTIDCVRCDLEVPVLDLRHLVHLRKCKFSAMPAPGSLSLSQGEIDLSVLNEQVAAWSRLQHQVRGRVLYLDVHDYATKGLQAWPQGIEAFHNVQFLRLTCLDVWPCAGDDTLDLAHFADIPHVKLCAERKLHVKISVDSWKILEVQSSSTFSVAIPDVTAFLKGIGAFYFKFKSEERPEDLINKLKKAGAETGTALYEHVRNSRAPLVVLSNTKPEPSNLPFFDLMYLRARSKHEETKR